MWAAVCLSKSAQNQFIVNTCQYIYLHWENGFCWLFSTRLMPVCQIRKSNITTTVLLAGEIRAVTAGLKTVCLSQSPDSTGRQGYEIAAFFQRSNGDIQASLYWSHFRRLRGGAGESTLSWLSLLAISCPEMLLCSAFGNNQRSSKQAPSAAELPSCLQVVSAALGNSTLLQT